MYNAEIGHLVGQRINAYRGALKPVCQGAVFDAPFWKMACVSKPIYVYLKVKFYQYPTRYEGGRRTGSIFFRRTIESQNSFNVNYMVRVRTVARLALTALIGGLVLS